MKVFYNTNNLLFDSKIKIRGGIKMEQKNMKNLYFGIIALVILLVSTLTVFAAETSIFDLAMSTEQKCSHPACLEGTNVTFSVDFTNNFGTAVKINGIVLDDLARPNTPLASYYQEPVILADGESYNFLFATKVKAPSEGYTTYYRTCVDVTTYKKPIEGALKTQLAVDKSAVLCRTNEYSLTTVPISKVECWTDSECKDTEVCKMYLYKCKPVECFFGAAKDHKCYSYDKSKIIVVGILIILLIWAIAKIAKKRKKKSRKSRKKEEYDIEDDEEEQEEVIEEKKTAKKSKPKKKAAAKKPAAKKQIKTTKHQTKKEESSEVKTEAAETTEEPTLTYDEEEEL